MWIATSALVLAMVGQASADGCLAVGTSGSVVDCRCDYQSDGSVDEIFIATEGAWEVSVERECPLFEPVVCDANGESCTACEPIRDPEDDCTLVDDNGCTPKLRPNGQPAIERRKIVLAEGCAIIDGCIPFPQPVEFQARASETVFAECLPSQNQNGPLGFIAVNPDDVLAEETGVGLP